MDFPPAKYYGLRCPRCEEDKYYPPNKKFIVELLMTLEFKPPLKTELGLLFGFGRFEHNCKPKITSEE